MPSEVFVWRTITEARRSRRLAILEQTYSHLLFNCRFKKPPASLQLCSPSPTAVTCFPNEALMLLLGINNQSAPHQGSNYCCSAKVLCPLMSFLCVCHRTWIPAGGHDRVGAIIINMIIRWDIWVLVMALALALSLACLWNLKSISWNLQDVWLCSTIRLPEFFKTADKYAGDAHKMQREIPAWFLKIAHFEVSLKELDGFS